MGRSQQNPGVCYRKINRYKVVKDGKQIIQQNTPGRKVIIFSPKQFHDLNLLSTASVFAFGYLFLFSGSI